MSGARPTYESGAADWDQKVSAFTGQYSPLLLDLLELQPGQRVLEVACGGGRTALAAGPRVAPGGSVVAVDIARAMLQLCRENCADAPVPVLPAQGDAARLPFADGAFDVVFCQFGLMLLDDHVAGAAELLRVLRPGGRLAVVVWAEAETMRSVGIPADAVDAEAPASWEHGRPALFRLGRDGALPDVLHRAGAAHVELTRQTHPDRYRDVEAYLRGHLEGRFGVARVVQSLPVHVQARVRERVRAGVRPYVRRDGLVLPCEAIYARAVKP